MEFCRDLTRARAGNFYYGLRMTPEPRRSAMYALYAWTRIADDLADGDAGVPPDRAVHELQALRVRTHAAFDRVGSTPSASFEARDVDHPSIAARLWPAFEHAVRAYPIREEWCLSLLDGMEADLSPVPPRDLPELFRYCDQVAGTVGQMCVSVWGLREGVDPERAFTLARERGRAFQLTNVLRDIDADHRLAPPRLYIPADMLAGHGLTAEALREWREPARCAALIRDLAARARTCYESSARLESMIEGRCGPVLRALTTIYRTLLDRIDADPRRAVLTPSVRLSAFTKARLAMFASINA